MLTFIREISELPEINTNKITHESLFSVTCFITFGLDIYSSREKLVFEYDVLIKLTKYNIQNFCSHVEHKSARG